ncbi:MAG: HIG1 domain-containing protein [Burkholderiales bacterium]
MEAMQPAGLLFFLAILGMLATAMALFDGVLSMTEGHNPDPHHSEKLMFRRVGLQALTVALVVVALLT